MVDKNYIGFSPTKIVENVKMGNRAENTATKKITGSKEVKLLYNLREIQLSTHMTREKETK